MTNFTDTTSTGSFNIGALITESIGILNAALPRFLVLAIIPIIPPLLSLIFVGAPTPENMGSFFYVSTIATLVSIILLFAIQGAMIYGAFNELRGRQFTIGDALSKGFARFLPLLGVSILSGLAISIGLMLFILPGLWLFCLLYSAAPVCVVEQRGVTDSMSRSSELTKGYRWPILGLILIIGIGSAVVSYVLTYIATLIGGFVIGNLVSMVVQVYAIALGSVLAALAYYRLRSIKEGVDIDRIADVFD